MTEELEKAKAELEKLKADKLKDDEDKASQAKLDKQKKDSQGTKELKTLQAEIETLKAERDETKRQSLLTQIADNKVLSKKHKDETNLDKLQAVVETALLMEGVKSAPDHLDDKGEAKKADEADHESASYNFESKTWDFI